MNNLEIKNINIGQIHGYERNGGVDNIIQICTRSHASFIVTWILHT